MIRQIIRKIILLMICLHSAAYAKTIIITGKTVIDKPTLFRDVVLDLSHGYFFITNNANLIIQNIVINGNISPDNPQLIEVNEGGLILKQNKVNIIATNVPLSPNVLSIYKAIHVVQGHITLDGNYFGIDKFYSAGL